MNILKFWTDFGCRNLNNPKVQSSSWRGPFNSTTQSFRSHVCSIICPNFREKRHSSRKQTSHKLPQSTQCISFWSNFFPQSETERRIYLDAATCTWKSIFVHSDAAEGKLYQQKNCLRGSVSKKIPECKMHPIFDMFLSVSFCDKRHAREIEVLVVEKGIFTRKFVKNEGRQWLLGSSWSNWPMG